MRTRLVCLAVLVVTIGFAAVGAAPASAPPAGTVTVPTTAGGSVSDAWTGTAPVGSNPTSECNGLPTAPEDHHQIKITVAPATYTTVTATFTFSISWTPTSAATQTSDLILTVLAPDGSVVGSSDGSSTGEKVVAKDLADGTYDVVTCGYVNSALQPYNGRLDVTTAAAGVPPPPEPSLPSAPAQGLQFSAAVPADNQRDESEPLMEIDKAGNTYTCGPTGFSNASDYAQVSTDG